MRSRKEIAEAREEYWDRVWLNRHFILARGYTERGNEMLREAYEAAQKKLDQYGDDAIVDEYELRFLEGKLSALRWVLGDDWDFLDT